MGCIIKPEERDWLEFIPDCADGLRIQSGKSVENRSGSGGSLAKLLLPTKADKRQL